jgi:beta-lactamase superfamily II metal-dependent hydrolase
MVVDGGFVETGEMIVQNIRRYYGTERVDVVVSTHPDNDHINGLEKVLRELEVGMLWMHQPWLHSVGPDKLFISRTQVSGNVIEKIARNLQAQQGLEVLATAQGVPIYEPFGFAHAFDGQIVILGPSRPFYEQLLAEETRETKTAALARTIAKMVREGTAPSTEAITTWLEESWDIETLTDTEVTSPINESSVIFELRHDRKRLLFTGDAGQRALSEAADAIDNYGLGDSHYQLVQIPHHGSGHNVGPGVLNRLVGERGTNGEGSWTAVACAATKGDPAHPSKKVLNAFTRRGAKAYATRSQSLRYQRDAPPRPSWSPATPEPLHLRVED